MVVTRSFTRWRERVWQYSLRLLEAGSPAERAAVRRAMEREAIRRAEALLGHRGVGGLRHVL